MKFRSLVLIASSNTTTMSWTFLIFFGLLVIHSLAENRVNQTEEMDSIARNSSENNESIQHSSILSESNLKKKSRKLHKLDYSIKEELLHESMKNSGLQNRSFESKISPMKNLDKISFTIKPTTISNNKSPAQGKKEIYEGKRKSSSHPDAPQYNSQAYKDYYQQQHQKQLQKQTPGVEYTDTYNTITSNGYIDEYKDYKDYKDYQNAVEEQEVQNWRNSYYPSGDGSSASYGCSCYKQVSPPLANNRQTTCDSPGASFLQTLGMLLSNAWQLIQIMATSAIPFIIPILVLKLIIVPIKIFKFLQLIKFFFKLSIILPFVIRVLYPAISNGLGMQNWFDSKDTHPDHQYDQSESREESNATGSWNSDIKQFIKDYINITDDTRLRSCVSKTACELGSFLSSSTETKFPEKLSKYLIQRAEGAEETEKENKKGDSMESEKDSAIRAFIIALGKKWPMEQCTVYTCSVVL